MYIYIYIYINILNKHIYIYIYIYINPQTFICSRATGNYNRGWSFLSQHTTPDLGALAGASVMTPFVLTPSRSCRFSNFPRALHNCSQL